MRLFTSQQNVLLKKHLQLPKTDVRLSWMWTERKREKEKSRKNVFSHSQLTIHKNMYTQERSIQFIIKNPSLITLQLQIVTLKEEDKSFHPPLRLFLQCYSRSHSLCVCVCIAFSSAVSIGFFRMALPWVFAFFRHYHLYGRFRMALLILYAVGYVALLRKGFKRIQNSQWPNNSGIFLLIPFINRDSSLCDFSSNSVWAGKFST